MKTTKTPKLKNNEFGIIDSFATHIRIGSRYKISFNETHNYLNSLNKVNDKGEPLPEVLTHGGRRYKLDTIDGLKGLFKNKLFLIEIN